MARWRGGSTMSESNVCDAHGVITDVVMGIGALMILGVVCYYVIRVIHAIFD